MDLKESIPIIVYFQLLWLNQYLMETNFLGFQCGVIPQNQINIIYKQFDFDFV